jgi:hypothetical protein
MCDDGPKGEVQGCTEYSHHYDGYRSEYKFMRV